MFDQVLEKNYRYPQYEIYIIWFVMESSLIFYLLGIANVVILFYNLGQTFKWLTCMKINTPYILERR